MKLEDRKTQGRMKSDEGVYSTVDAGKDRNVSSGGGELIQLCTGKESKIRGET